MTPSTRRVACSPTSPRPRCYRDLVGEDHLPARFVRSLDRFQWDHGTFKIDWALSGPIPWRVEPATRAGTVHLCDSMDRVIGYAGRARQGPDPRAPVRADRPDEQGRSHSFTARHRDRVGLHPRSSFTAGRRRRRAHRNLERPRLRAVRRPIGIGHRRARARVPRAHHRSAPLAPTGARSARRQPGRRCARRRHDGVLPTARVPAGARAGPSRDAGARVVPRLGVGAPRRRRPRGMWCERRTGRALRQTACGG